MANVVGDIAIQIGADIGPLVTNLGKAQGQISKFGDTAHASASGGMKAFTLAGAAMGAAAGAAAVGIVALVKSAIDSAGALHDASSATGVHVAQLQAMSQVAEEASVSSESLISSLKKMENNIAGLASGTKTQVAAFAELGLTMADLAGKNPDEQFATIADAISKLGDPTERVSAAMNIFGKTGADLIPVMDGYRASLADVTAQQEKFGISLSDDQAAQLDNLGDTMGRLGMAAQGLGTQLAIAFGPALIEATNLASESLQGWILIFEKANDLLTTSPIEQEFKDIGDATGAAAARAEQAADAFQGIADGNLSKSLADQAEALRNMEASFKAGAMTADEYRTRVNAAFEKIKALLATIGEVDGSDMSHAISAMESYRDAIFGALGVATDLANAQIKIGAAASSGTGGITLTPDAVPGAAGVSAGSTAPATISVNGSGGGHSDGGGGGGRNLEDELTAMREALGTEAEAADAAYADQLKKLEEFRQAKLLSEEDFNSLEQDAEKKHTEAMAAINEAAMSSRLDAISGAFGDLSGLMQTHNKSLFEIGKAGAIASAIVDGYSAATSAWDKGMKIGGPPVAAAFTAASLLKTGSLIAGIASTQYGSKSGATAGGGSGAPATPATPLQANLNLIGTGDFVKKSDLSGLLDMLNTEAGDRGYQLLVAS